MQPGDGADHDHAYFKMSSGPQETACGSGGSGSTPPATACGSGRSGLAETTPPETACGSSASGIAKPTPPETACGSSASALAKPTPPGTACGSSGSGLAKSTPEAVACGSGGATAAAGSRPELAESKSPTVGGVDGECNLSKREMERRTKGYVRRRAGTDQEYYHMWYKVKRSNWDWEKPAERE